jgi:hypothetical protein
VVPVTISGDRVTNKYTVSTGRSFDVETPVKRLVGGDLNNDRLGDLLVSGEFGSAVLVSDKKTMSGIEYRATVDLPAGFQSLGVGIADLDNAGVAGADVEVAILSLNGGASGAAKVNVLRNDSIASGSEIPLVLAQSVTVPADETSIGLLLADVNGDGANDVLTLSTPTTAATANVRVAQGKP